MKSPKKIKNVAQVPSDAGLIGEWRYKIWPEYAVLRFIVWSAWGFLWLVLFPPITFIWIPIYWYVIWVRIQRRKNGFVRVYPDRLEVLAVDRRRGMAGSATLETAQIQSVTYADSRRDSEKYGTVTVVASSIFTGMFFESIENHRELAETIRALATRPMQVEVTEPSKIKANSTAQDSTKECPFCAEDVKFAAIKCKHCGSDLSLA